MNKYIESKYFSFDLENVLFNAKDKDYTVFNLNPNHEEEQKLSFSLPNHQIDGDKLTFRIKLTDKNGTTKTYKVWDNINKKENIYTADEFYVILAAMGYQEVKREKIRKKLYLNPQTNQ